MFINLGSSEADQAEFIKKINEEWKNIKIDLVKFITKMKESWTVETDAKEDLGYLG